MNTELITYVRSSFFENFKLEPVLAYAPGRINIIGEHTDYNVGFVLPAAIDKGIVVAVQKSASKFCRVIALNKNETYEFSLDTINSIPNGGWRNYVLGVVAEILKKKKTLFSFNIVFAGDIPSGAGLSSSAALENGIAVALNEVFKLRFTKEELIYISQKAEHNYVGVKCGIMDQYASMFGKKSKVLLLDCKIVKAKPIEVNFDDYEIVLINTNIKHNLSESAYNARRSVCEKVALKLGVKALRDVDEKALMKIKKRISEDDYQKALYVIQENRRVLKAVSAIKDNNIKVLGRLLYKTHEGLKNKYKVSCDELDFLVEQTTDISHILGARMMGGGFGGCVINIIKKNSNEVLNQITEAYQTKFNIKPSVYYVKLNDGVKII